MHAPLIDIDTFLRPAWGPVVCSMHGRCYTHHFCTINTFIIIFCGTLAHARGAKKWEVPGVPILMISCILLWHGSWHGSWLHVGLQVSSQRTCRGDRPAAEHSSGVQRTPADMTITAIYQIQYIAMTHASAKYQRLSDQDPVTSLHRRSKGCGGVAVAAPIIWLLKPRLQGRT